MKLEDATWEWVDDICGERVEGYGSSISEIYRRYYSKEDEYTNDKVKPSRFGIFDKGDYIKFEMVSDRENSIRHFEMVTGLVLKHRESLDKRKKLMGIDDCGDLERHDSKIDFYGCSSVSMRDVTKAFNQLEFPSQGIDDIIMEVAFFRSETRDEVVGQYGRDLFTLLKLLRKEREKFLGGI